MGESFVVPPAFNLENCFPDADSLTPLIFILSTGADPRQEIKNLADKMGIGNNLFSISLG